LRRVAVIKAMNSVGMLIDVAHASEATALGVIQASTKPVMASHVHIHTEHLHNLPLYVTGLLKRGTHEPEVAKLIGGNFLRVFSAVQSTG
jgi:microsomal dipeptidase-like Zn-dependent dipeptidase